MGRRSVRSAQGSGCDSVTIITALQGILLGVTVAASLMLAVVLYAVLKRER